MQKTDNEQDNEANFGLTKQDLEIIKNHGISVQTVNEQLQQFQRGQIPITILKPATPGDGILCFEKSKAEHLISIFDAGSTNLKLLKFVPASGAATRMFKTLIHFSNHLNRIDAKEIKEKSHQGNPDEDYSFMAKFIEGIEKGAFAFMTDLEEAMAADGLNLKDFINKGEYKTVIDYLLNEKGLDYANLPKALLKFHTYGDSSRTALEEHLVEGKAYCTGRGGEVNIHFTVSEQHKEKIRRVLEQSIPRHENDNLSFSIDLSEQKSSTDTVAVDKQGHLFRDKEGKPVLRPGGHGALIENLKRLDGDVIFIKNIDNIVPDRLKDETIYYKKMLAGLLIEIRQTINGFFSTLLEGKPDQEDLDDMFRYCEVHLNMSLASRPAGIEEQKNELKHMLNRPIRICGMVKNEGEPGGGPFWIKDKDGRVSLQIVESAQIDLNNPDNQKIVSQATHFNPVDLVCCIRDFQNNAFDLDGFIDHDAYFISTKSQEGKTLKALELPGLWNGAMAGWITIFVEVPIITFNPTKTINDLLRPQHQPG